MIDFANMIFILAVLPLILIIWNSILIRPLRPCEDEKLPTFSVLIPARDEATNIIACLDAIMASDCLPNEIIVLDDHSNDQTAKLVEDYSQGNPVVHLISGANLPSGWIGKNFACQQLAEAANGDYLIFIDADVRLNPNATGRLIQRMKRKPKYSLISAIPKQQTVSWSEKSLLPLIPYLIMGYLPIALARLFSWSAFGAAIGQLIVVQRGIYFEVGGHAAIKNKIHEGIALARLWRHNRQMTDIVFGSDLALVRMYQNWREVFCGLAKNAREGMGRPLPLVIWSVLLGGGHVVAYLFVGIAIWRGNDCREWIEACIISLMGRIIVSAPRGESLVGALLHPVGIIVLLGIQLWSCLNSRRAAQISWRGRTYSP